MDLLREMVRNFAETLMSADADSLCGAEYGVVSERRVNRRTGYRTREWDTRAGTVELSIPSCARAAASRRGCWSRVERAPGRRATITGFAQDLGPGLARLAVAVRDRCKFLGPVGPNTTITSRHSGSRLPSASGSRTCGYTPSVHRCR